MLLLNKVNFRHRISEVPIFSVIPSCLSLYSQPFAPFRYFTIAIPLFVAKGWTGLSRPFAAGEVEGYNGGSPEPRIAELADNHSFTQKKYQKKKYFFCVNG